ncbi:lytic transglycosylase domain-containing protein [Viridibacterium curvum]|uniref:Lytic transglycosylase domain-containing protein n=1 Tax=Viridibacterium curvum TaxID=1101404 RepID=A0ABP9QTE5_9RHOO
MVRRLWCALLLGLGLHASVFAQTVTEGGERRIYVAREAAQRGDTARLEQMLADPGPHALEPYIGYWLWSARIARSSESFSTTALQTFLTRYDGSFIAERLRADWLKRLGREGQYPLFNEEYARLQQPDQELQCFAIRAGNPASEALLLALEAQWLTLTDTPESCFTPLQLLVDSSRKSNDDIWWRVRRTIEANRLSAARHAVSMLGEEGRDSGALAQVFDNPERYLKSVAARNASSRAAREWVLASVARLARRNPRNALAGWRAIHDASYTAGERAYVMGQLAWGGALTHMPESHRWFEEARKLDATQPMSDEQAAWQVRMALRALDWPRVQAAIEQMSPLQRNQPEWIYWLARSHSMQGRPELARPLHEKRAGEPDFYGILSAEALGRPLHWPAPPAPPSTQELQQVAELDGVRRAIALLRMDMRLEGLREWNWTMRGLDDRRLIAAAEHARRLGIYDRAIFAAERTKTQHDYSLRYLAPFYDAFSREARTQQLSLAWIYGLTRQESRFITSARSPVGAQGLMQIMPATGRLVARQIGVAGFSVGDLGDTDTNVRLGAAYLRSVLDGLSSSPVMATAAYNAGPGRARRWQAEQALEGAIYAESIPFTETRDYVKKVMANAVAYSVLFDGKPMSMTRFMGRVPAYAGGSRGDEAEP